MDSLAEFVARYAPDLVGAVEERDDAESDERWVDAEVARLLTRIWLAGPPYADAVARAQRGFYSRRGELIDLIDTGSSGPAMPPQLDPNRLHRLQDEVERQVYRRTRWGSTVRLAQGAAAGAVAVLLTLGAVQVLRSSDPAEPAASVPSGSATEVVETAAPLPSASCAYAICSWRYVETWSLGVREAVYDRLEPDGEVLGTTDRLTMSTGVRVAPTEKLVTAGFGTAVAGVEADVGVWITATSNPDLLAECGHYTGEPCIDRVTASGHKVRISATDKIVEVYRRSGGGSWVSVRVEARDEMPFSVDRIMWFAVDRRLGLQE